MTAKAAPAARAVAVVLLAALSLASCSSGASAPSTNPTVKGFLTAWQSRDWSRMESFVLGRPSGFVAVNEAELSDLGASGATFSAGAPSVSGSQAVVPVSEKFSLPVFGSFVVATRLHLVLVGKHWRVRWSPSTVDPLFRTGSHFAVSYRWPNRAPILYANGSIMASLQASGVVIGVEGVFIKDPSVLASDLESAGAPAAAVQSAIAAAQASPSAFEPVFQVSEARYEQLRPALYPVPGTVFRTTGGGVQPPSELAAVVGSLGTITKPELEALGPPYTSSSVVGQGGIEQAEERQLAGTPGGNVTVVSASGRTVATVLTKAPVPGKAVRTSIEPSIEQAAAQAMSVVSGHEAAMVAIDASTDQVIAAVNDSAGTTDFALDGEQPPGSTFKVITSTALIEHGLTPSSPATCPPVLNVDGENFHNASPSDVANNMLQAFTISCNTAFMGLTVANLNFSSLHRAAALYDLGVTPKLGAVAFGGSVPVNNGETDFAASAIGQARVVVNPLNLASVAAAIDTGVVREPRLVAGAPDDTAPTHPLPSNVVRYLHEMMLSVVQSGTASGTGLPAGTYAKTGTAEYGSGSPLLIDGWLMGFNGNIAFAICVTNSPLDGGPEDGPIIASFFRSIGVR